jgi:hypothetical protein
MAKTLNSALSTIYDRFVFTGSTRSEFYYTGGIGGDDTQVTALQLTTLKNVDDEVVLTTDSSQDASFANDVKLLSDASVLNFGAHNDVKLTHVHNTGLLLSQDGSGSIPVLQIREAGLAISSSTSGQLDIDAGTELELGAPTIDINASTACEIDNTNTTNGVKVGVNTDGGKVFIGHTTSETTVNDNLTVTGTTALSDHATVAVNKQLKFGDGAQHIATDNTDLTITTDADLILAVAQVGIGTAEPGALFHVASSAANPAQIITSSVTNSSLLIGNTSSGTAALVLDASNGDGAGSDYMHMWQANDLDGHIDMKSSAYDLILQESGGKVGIGTGTPGFQLELQKASGGELHLSTTDTVITGGIPGETLGTISFGADDATSGFTNAVGAKIVATAPGAWDDTTNAPNDAPTDLLFYAQSSGTLDGMSAPVMSMGKKDDGTSRVGIGMAPDTAFNVKGAADSGIRLYKSDANTLLARMEGDDTEDARVMLYDSDGDLDIYFHAQVDANSYIKTGNVGIGTDSPDHLLHVEVSSGEQEVRVTSDSLADTENSKILMEGKKSGGSSRYAGAGVVYNDAVAQAAGYLRCDAHDGVAAYIYLDEDDDLQVSNVAAHVGTTSGQELHDDITASDERLKEISPDAFPYGLSTINSLSPIKFRYKYKIKNDWKLGLGAQTTQPIVPETVIDTDLNVEGLAEGETKLRMSYSQFIPILIKAIQELSAKVTALENA